MKLKSLSLTLANVARTSNARTLEAVNAGTQKKRDETKKLTEDIDFAYVECAARRGDILKIKFPAELAEKVLDLNRQLDRDEIISISFQNLKLVPYALKAQDGSVLSGVSAKADDFTIESPDAGNFDDIEI